LEDLQTNMKSKKSHGKKGAVSSSAVIPEKKATTNTTPSSENMNPRMTNAFARYQGQAIQIIGAKQD